VIDLADLLKQSLGKAGTPRKSASRKPEAARSPPELRVVRGARATAKPAGRGAAKPAAKRKRA